MNKRQIIILKAMSVTIVALLILTIYHMYSESLIRESKLNEYIEIINEELEDVIRMQYYGIKPFLEYKNPNDNFFSILVIPDSQSMAIHSHDKFRQHIQWIVDNEGERKISFVVHVGDVITLGNSTESSTDRWELASSSMQLLQDADIPYLVIPGNHDLYFLDTGVYDVEDSFSKYFPDGHNVYSFFNTSDGLEFIVVGFEYDPSSDVLRWVNDTLNMYPDKHAILFTHSFMGRNGKRTDIGEHAYDVVVQYHSNIMMVLSGHVVSGYGNSTMSSYGSTGYRKDGTTHQLLANYQGSDLSGTLRWYECYPDVGKVFVRTYSPIWDEWMVCRNNSFIFDYDFKRER